MYNACTSAPKTLHLLSNDAIVRYKSTDDAAVSDRYLIVDLCLIHDSSSRTHSSKRTDRCPFFQNYMLAERGTFIHNREWIDSYGISNSYIM